MKLIVGTEAMFFLALIMAFIYFSNTPGFKAHQLANLDIKTTGIFSILLFSSSFTFWRAEKNHSKGEMGRLKIWLLLTILLGAVFLAGQAKEYMGLLSNQVNISSSMFGTGFFHTYWVSRAACFYRAYYYFYHYSTYFFRRLQ